MHSALQRTIGDEVLGLSAAVRFLAVALVTGGHVLLEGVPGTAKTMLVRRFSQALSLTFKRIQFTPDMLPTDITGTMTLNPGRQEFEYRPGPVFANVVLADEINRAPPKVQSALLEAMQENQVTVDGVAHPLPQPFMVIATQNPVEQEGTYPLPEAELDRFMFRAIIGYPTRGDELGIVGRHAAPGADQPPRHVVDAEIVSALKQASTSVFLKDDVLSYLVDLIRATREDPRILIGASPRAGVQFARAVKAAALFEGRSYVTPEDVKSVAFEVLNHRMSPRPNVVAQQYSSGAGGIEPVLREILDSALDSLVVPR